MKENESHSFCNVVQQLKLKYVGNTATARRMERAALESYTGMVVFVYWSSGSVALLESLKPPVRLQLTK